MKKTAGPKILNEVLVRGVEQVYPSPEGLENLLAKKKIKVYQGFDPSMPSLHLGNLVGILKLKQFQELGHEVICLIGDFTGTIGDPTNKASCRKKQSRQDALRNAESWKEQFGRFLNFSGDNPAKILFNSQWLDKITFKDLIEITSNFTVQRMSERDFFQNRIKEQKPIFLHEFLYPVAQALDSVNMGVDLEIGGSDQMFNMMMGRDLMKATSGKEKFILTMRLLVDRSGNKIGKTTGGAVFLNAKPEEMFGQIMSFPDEGIIPGFELLTTIPADEISVLKNRLNKKGANPRDVKKELALEIVKLNYGAKVAESAANEFEKVFEKGDLPTDVPRVDVRKDRMDILDLLSETKISPSKSDAKRMILQKGVKINNKVVESWRQEIEIKEGMIIQIGKRKFVKIRK